MAPKPSSSSGGAGDGGRDGGGEGASWNATVAKAVWFFVLSGIGVSLVKSLVSKPGQPLRASIHNSSESSSRNPPAGEVLGNGSPSARTVRVEKGDTLWGLSKRYGVSVNAIREANGITGNTIYAGKKLVIP